MGYERSPDLLTRLRRSLRAAGGARAALAAVVIAGSALGVMRLVAVAPPLPSAGRPADPSGPPDSAEAGVKDSTAEDSAAEARRHRGGGPGGR